MAMATDETPSDEGLTGSHPGMIDWEFDPKTKTFYITPNETNTRNGYGFTINGNTIEKNYLWTWRKNYSVYADAVEHIHVSDLFTDYHSYQHESSIFANRKNLKTIYLGKLAEISGAWQSGDYWTGIGNFTNVISSGSFANNPNLTIVWGYGQEPEEGTVKDTGDYHFATYERDSGLDDAYPKFDYFVVDGTKKLSLTEIYVGQNTPESSEVYEISRERAAQFKDRDDLDRDGDTEEQMLGWTMDLRCICGRGHIGEHDAFDYDNSGYEGRICGMSHPGMADQGLASMGNDYFYVSYYNNQKIDGVTYYGQHAVFHRLRRCSGAWAFVEIK